MVARKFIQEFLLSFYFMMQYTEFKEDHPLAVNISSSISLGLLPVTLSLKMTGCGIKNSAEAGDAEKKGKQTPMIG